MGPYANSDTKKPGAKAGRVLGTQIAVLSARDDSYVSDLRLFNQPMRCGESVVLYFSDIGLAALCPNLFEKNTLNDVLRNESPPFLKLHEIMFPINVL